MHVCSLSKHFKIDYMKRPRFIHAARNFKMFFSGWVQAFGLSAYIMHLTKCCVVMWLSNLLFMLFILIPPLDFFLIFRWFMSCVFITRKKRSIKSRSVLMLQSLTRTTLLFYLSSEFISQMGAHDIEDALIWKKKIELLIDQVQSVCNPFLGYDTIAEHEICLEKSLDFNRPFR